MTDETAYLVLERLKRFPAQMLRFEDRLDTVQQDIRSIKQHMTAFMASGTSQDERLATIEVRLDRIERRLDLTE